METSISMSIPRAFGGRTCEEGRSLGAHRVTVQVLGLIEAIGRGGEKL